ncbi:MAG: hypothetical protein PHY04_03165 [Candidatus ainarchaeum sp.]|jgi:hypothetical protein|nr:hypothetical protein [Candidatus ainarchaeum sp.]MDD3086057.1 hypothetical protein [Candidatus ainarchaeum sp.]MDD4128709.1 hypothetical protein [Candidatus ainarchaeum sp.]MDD4467937.1 hypothetical protein [Candidatus ainarchaeum sp.]HPM86275.1 hypothetical protein [archaeon]
MVNPVLRQIQIIVFPSFGGNLELHTKEGSRKFNQWIKQIELAGKRKDTAFLIIPDAIKERNVYSKRIKEALKKNLPTAHYFLSPEFAYSQKKRVEEVSFIINSFLKKRFTLPSSIKIIRYGQHAPSACVEEYGGELSKSLSKNLSLKRITVLQKSANGLSIKYPSDYLLSIANKRMGEEMDSLQAKNMSWAASRLFSKKRVSPVRIAHALRRGNSFEEITQNLSKLKRNRIKIRGKF